MDVIVNLREIEKIKGLLEDKLEFDVKWNSNPKNYTKLVLSILKETRCSLGEIFLRDFFWDKKKSTFRLSNVDILYQFTFGNIRSNVLGENVGEVFYKGEMDAQSLEHLKKNDIDLMPLDSLIERIQQNDKDSYIYVNEAFLKDKQGGKLLLLLLEHLTKIVGDINRGSGIKFKFEPSLIRLESSNEILTDKGRLTYIRYWKNVIDENKEVGGELAEMINEDLKTFIEPPFFMALKALAEIAIKKIDLTVNLFQPFIKEIKKIPIKNLSDIYKSNLEEQEKFNFLCVIGYQKYLEGKEQQEMKKYFASFNTTLIKQGHKVKRIFTIPSEFKKTILTPIFNERQLEILLNYLKINIETKAETYIFLYDVNKQNELKSLLLYQDYVIRLNSEKATNLEDILYVDTPDDTMLYLAYPEDLNGINRMIEIKSTNEIFKYIEDFKNRMGSLNNLYSRLEKVDSNNYSDWV